MNLTRPHNHKKTKAQAMVEFALALPILLTLLYGLLETGRLLFIYASTVTAARQAARYGSATGDGPNGVPYYQDCVGITGAAEKVGFINTFASIDITYDAGLWNETSGGHTAGDPRDLNPALPDCGSFTTVENGDRIVVEVNAEWVPIVPLVPFDAFTITSQSERTILSSVPIYVTAVPNPYIPSNTGILTLTKTADIQNYSFLGQTITYIYGLSNTGSGDLTGPFTVSDNKVGSVNCSGAPGTLAVGASFNCTGTYQITQIDLDAGSVTNIATPAANGIPFATATETIGVANNIAFLSLDKTASPTAASVVGTNIIYTYTLTNTGQVTLTSPYTIVDDKIPGTNNCPGAASSIAPGASTTCQAVYSITGANVAAGSVTNTATATAYYPFREQTITSNSDSAIVVTSPLSVVISASPNPTLLPNQVITYSYLVSNNSSSTVNSLSVTNTKGTLSCPSTSIVANGSMTCTGTYTMTLADYNAGGAIINTATATGNNGSPISSTTATSSVAITQNATLSAAVVGSPAQPTSPATTLAAGTLVTYTYTLTNSGNVTLSAPFAVTDDKSTISCAAGATMVPGATKTCTGTHTVTAAEVTAGSIINTGTASATFGAAAVTSAPASFTVITFSGARFSLALSANPTSITQSNTSVVFTYTITNTGGKSLSSPYSITSSLASIGTFTCSGTSPLAPGLSTSCTNNVTSSNTITNTITAATAKDGVATVASSNLPTITVIANICSTGTLTLSAPVISGRDATWTISNNIGTPLTVTSVLITWNSGSGFHLNSVELPAGTSIWSGLNKTGSITISGSWTIPTGNTNLVATLNKINPTITDMNLTFSEAGCGPLNNP